MESTPELESVRADFRKAYHAAERGRLKLSSPKLQALQDYVLYPDLLAAHFKARLRQESPAKIEAFIQEYGHLKTVENLRRRWLRHLAARGRWESFLDIYTGEIQAKYQCLWVTARLRTGERESIIEDALPLWMVGESQARECDPVFAYLEAAGALNVDRKRARVVLALEARELDLARYLARSLPDEDRALVSTWRNMHQQPGQQLVAANLPDSPQARAVLRYGVERLAKQDPFHAWKTWNGLQDQYDFSDSDHYVTSRNIAIQSALSNHPSATHLLTQLDSGAKDESVGHWRVRLALKKRDWPEILAAINDMPSTEAEREIFRYWQARALEQIGDRATADAMFHILSLNRSYYGFLSADRLGRPYVLNHQPAQADEEGIAALGKTSSILRARELFALGFYSLARSAWNEAMEPLTVIQTEQAAILAHRWGWHSRAIALASKNGLVDDLEIRYPLAFEELIVKKSKQKKIDATWAFGIARSESLFMPDVASSAGALGLMQVMPATGKTVAKRNNVRYSSWRSLLNPTTNVTLGTAYLRDMRARFNQNVVLASAAYNAGPHRVQRWLPKEEMEADIWVDTIPFKETRDYVRRVMASQIIFHWRLTGNEARLAATMPKVHPAGGTTKGANSVAAF